MLQQELANGYFQRAYDCGRRRPFTHLSFLSLGDLGARLRRRIRSPHDFITPPIGCGSRCPWDARSANGWLNRDAPRSLQAAAQRDPEPKEKRLFLHLIVKFIYISFLD